MTKAVMFRMRVTEAELAVWKMEAAREGLTVSSWLRRRAGVAPPLIPERPPVKKKATGTPVAAPIVPPYDKDRDQAPPVEPETCQRCGHARASHWIKGCLAGCLCSEGRYRE